MSFSISVTTDNNSSTIRISLGIPYISFKLIRTNGYIIMLRNIRKSIGLAKSAYSFTHQPHRSIFGLSSIFNSLKGQFQHAIEPGPGLHNTHSMEATETELFDEDAHETQAMVTNNVFDLEIMMGDTNPMRQFGTVDNPVILFSANVGWRYVMCSGLNDEEEGLSHQGIWFILREGSIHRCSGCGQCFKLVSLKDEISEENDYYLEHYMPILEEEMGDDDDLVTRFSFHKFTEPYAVLHPHQNSNWAYILVNPDDHDRILTDPAYRMQKLLEGHDTLNDVHSAFIKLEDQILWQRGGFYPKFEYSVGEYEDLITSEMAIRKLDRIFDKITTFEKRAILEPLDHERREARMQSRAEDRAKNVTTYVNTNELEQKYKDYYETDVDPLEELMEEREDYEELVSTGIFNFKNYEFVEENFANPVPAIAGLYEKKIFKFKHRKWNDDPANHFIRENRMIRRYLDRLQTRDKTKFIEEQELVDFAGKKFKKKQEFEIKGKLFENISYIADEAIQQYKDYYESDVEDIKDLDYISPEEKASFAQVFKDYSKPIHEPKYVILTPIQKLEGKSLFASISAQVSDVRAQVNKAVSKEFTPNKDFKYHHSELDIQDIEPESLEELFGHSMIPDPVNELDGIEETK